jgi:hypothetical protein
LTQLRLQETGRFWKSMHRFRNDLGFIAVIAPVLRKSAEAGSHSVAAVLRRALAGAVVMCVGRAQVCVITGHVSVSLLELDVFRLNRFRIPKPGWL